MKLGKTCSGVILAVSCIATNAAPQWCSGTMANLWIYSDGSVYVYPSYREDYTRICNVNVDTNGVSAASCLVWFSILKSAVQRRSSVMIFYNDAPSCATLPTYGSSPVPAYVMQMD
jgi:hypothetical protein